MIHKVCEWRILGKPHMTKSSSAHLISMICLRTHNLKFPKWKRDWITHIITHIVCECQLFGFAYPLLSDIFVQLWWVLFWHNESVPSMRFHHYCKQVLFRSITYPWEISHAMFYDEDETFLVASNMYTYI